MSINLHDKIKLIDTYTKALSYNFSWKTINMHRIGNPVHDTFERTNRNSISPSISIEDEETLGQIEFKQKIGDCYLLSTIYALSRNQEGQKILENLIRFDDDGNYVIKFHNYDEVKVSEKELSENAYSDGDRVVQLLEYAFGKARNEKLYNNRLSVEEALTDGWQSVTINDICGWRADEIAPKTGYEKKVFSHYFDKLSPVKSKIIILAETGEDGKYKKIVNNEAFYFLDKHCNFPINHSFIISDIDSEKKTVTVVNPHDTKDKKYTISYDEFSNTFSNLIIGCPSRNEYK